MLEKVGVGVGVDRDEEVEDMRNVVDDVTGGWVLVGTTDEERVGVGLGVGKIKGKKL